MNLSLLTYTHSNCRDIHEIYFDSIKSFFPDIDHYVLTDEFINNSSITQVIYDNNSNYYEQIISALEKIKTDYLIYSQEDYILYDFVDKKNLEDLIKIMEEDKSVMFIRLINAGLSGTEKKYNEDLLIIDNTSEYFFSTQVTIWRKDILRQMFSISKTKFISEESNNSPFLKSLDGVGLCTNLKGERVGSHYNSIIYPYTAVAVLRGKWNFTEYGNILLDLLKKYNIDLNKRGTI